MSKIQAGDYIYIQDEWVRNREKMAMYNSAKDAMLRRRKTGKTFIAQNGVFRIIALYDTNSNFPQKINGPASYNQIGAIAINNGAGGSATMCYINKISLNWNRTVANSSYKPPQQPVRAQTRATTTTVSRPIYRYTNVPIIKYWNANTKAWYSARSIRKWDASRKRWSYASVKRWDGNKKTWNATAVGAPIQQRTVVRQPQTKTYTKVYGATWSQQYQGNNTQKNWTDPKQGSNGSVMHQGYCDPAAMWGIQKSMFGFNWQQIQRDLSGAKIKSVELYLANAHFWYYAGGRAVIGAHNSSSKPSTFSYTQYGIKDEYFTGRGQQKWITMPTGIGEQFRDGSTKGFTLYANSRDGNYYGYFHGANSSNKPKLKITYEK